MGLEVEKRELREHGYEPIKLIGEGGFGRVWLVQTRGGLGRAVKCVPLGIKADIELQGIVRMCQSFPLGDSRLVLPCAQHLAEEHLLIEMPLADNANGTNPIIAGKNYEPYSLQAYYDGPGRRQFWETIAVARDMLESLVALHQKGAYHNDVHPTNVLRFDGTWRLADCSTVTWNGTEPGALRPPYVRPDGIRGRHGDLYAAGRTLYCVYTGDAEFEKFDDYLRGDFDPDPAEPRSAELRAIIRDACNPDPRKVVASATDMRSRMLSMMQPVST